MQKLDHSTVWIESCFIHLLFDLLLFYFLCIYRLDPFVILFTFSSLVFEFCLGGKKRRLNFSSWLIYFKIMFKLSLTKDVYREKIRFVGKLNTYGKRERVNAYIVVRQSIGCCFPFSLYNISYTLIYLFFSVIHKETNGFQIESHYAVSAFW